MADRSRHVLQPLESLTVPLWVVRFVRVARFCILSEEKDLRNMSLNITARAHSLQKRVTFHGLQAHKVRREGYMGRDREWRWLNCRRRDDHGATMMQTAPTSSSSISHCYTTERQQAQTQLLRRFLCTWKEVKVPNAA